MLSHFSFLCQQFSKKHSIDPVLQQQIMDQIRRQNEKVSHELSVQKERQEADLQAKLESRRAKKRSEARRLAEEAAAQRILSEQQKLVGKDGGSGGLDDLQKLTPAKIAEMSMEEQVRCQFIWLICLVFCLVGIDHK